MNLEEAIEQALGYAERHELDPGEQFSGIASTLPDVFTFFFDDDTRLLSEQEHDYLLFLGMIFLKVAEICSLDLGHVSLDVLEERAEANWGLLEFTSIENLTTTLEASPFGELYFFLEDACSPVNNHDILTDAGVELVYVKCKSLIDCL